MADPFAIASGAISGIGAIGNLFTQNSANKKNIRFQREENEKNRKFAAQQADLAYQRQIEQWNRENDYNSPSASMARLKQAGLNPDLFYGSGVSNMSSGSLSSVSAGSASGSASPSQVPLDFSGIGQGALTAAQIRVMDAQADNLKADARKKGFEGDILESDASVRDALNSQQFTLGEMEIRVKGSAADLNEQQISNLREDLRRLKLANDNYDVTLDNLRASTANMSSSAVKNLIEAKLATPLARAQIQAFAARVHLDYATAREVLTLLPYKALNIKADTNLKVQQKATEWLRAQGLIIENERLEYELDLDYYLRPFERMQAIAPMFGGLVSILADDFVYGEDNVYDQVFDHARRKSYQGRTYDRRHPGNWRHGAGGTW